MNYNRGGIISAFFSLLFAFMTVGRPVLGAQGGKPVDPRVAVTLAVVENSPLDRTVSVVGTLYAKDEATISAEVEGRVEKTLVEMGDDVREQASLALIDTEAYEALALKSAATVAKAQASAANAEINLRREKELNKGGIATPSQLDQAQAEAEQWRAEVKSALASDAVARLNLARSVVRAPFQGTVAERLANGGDYAKVGTPLYRLVDDRTLKLITAVPERYASAVQKDQALEFTVDAFPGRKFVGKVYLISPSVNTTTRAFSVGALVPNQDRLLKANTYARGQLILERNVPTLTVPLDSVVTFAGLTKVFTVENDLAHERQVKLGRVHLQRVEVLEGLQPGERVVTTGQSRLFERAPVRLKEASASPVK